MVKKNLTHLILSLTFIIIFLGSKGQERVAYRIAANSNTFIREPGSSNAIINPSIANNIVPGTSMDFMPDPGYGFEAEIMFPVNKDFSLGIEFEHLILKGYNNNPIYFNYFTSPFSPITDYGQQPLVYNTVMNNLIGNIRYFLMKGNNLQPFIKAQGGVAFVGTNLRYKDPRYRIDIYDPLYARGTKLSTDTKWPVFYFGGGGGLQYRITDKILLYADATISFIQTDIVNGVPNFSYNDVSGVSEHFKTNSITTQVSVGICYSSEEGLKLFKKKIKHSKGFKNRKGKIDKYFPFHEIKR